MPKNTKPEKTTMLKAICECCPRFHRSIEDDVWSCFCESPWMKWGLKGTERDSRRRTVMTAEGEPPEDCLMEFEHQMVDWTKDAE